jgi:ABC-type sulfate transport system permease component
MNPVLLIIAETATSLRCVLNAIPPSLADARRRADRAAYLLGVHGDPWTWQGGRVVVLEAATRKLLAVSRVRSTQARKGVIR